MIEPLGLPRAQQIPVIHHVVQHEEPMTEIVVDETHHEKELPVHEVVAEPVED